MLIVDYLENLRDDPISEQLKLWQKLRVVGEQLLSLLIEHLLGELLFIAKYSRVFRHSQLSPEVHDDALHQVIRIAVEVVNHDILVGRDCLLFAYFFLEANGVTQDLGDLVLMSLHISVCSGW